MMSTDQNDGEPEADMQLMIGSARLSVLAIVGECVIGVELDTSTICADPHSAAVERGPVNDTLGDAPLLVVTDPTTENNSVVFRCDILVNEQTGTRRSFAGERRRASWPARR